MKKVILLMFVISSFVFTACKNNIDEDPKPATQQNLTNSSTANQARSVSARIGFLTDKNYQEELKALKNKYLGYKYVEIYWRDTIADAYNKELKNLIAKYKKSQAEYDRHSMFVLMMWGPDVNVF